MDQVESYKSRGSIIGLIGIIIISGAVVWSSSVLARGAVRFKTATEVVRVVGSASMPITSDLVIWTGTVTHQAPDLVSAYKGLKGDVSKVVTYLEKQGVDPKEISTKAIITSGLYAQAPLNPNNNGNSSSRLTYRKLVAYQLTEDVQVRSHNVQLISKLSRQVTDLLASGVNFQSNPPSYIYTKIGEAKIQILQKAAADARNRAETLAKSAGATLGQVRYIHMTPLDISPRDSVDLSGDGEYDTSSLNKTITAVVNMGVSLN